MAAGELSTVANRYAGALFDLARERSETDAVDQGLNQVERVLKDSTDFRRLIVSPAISSVEQQDALKAVFAKSGGAPLVRDFVLLLAKNRRLFVLEAVINAYKALMARERGEVEVSVVSAFPLTASQCNSFLDTLRQKLGKTPKLTASVDRKLLGGLVVRVGSQMIDTSLRTKLKNLEIAMKEAP